ncbi:winged helix-turn-helix transcriptional regulator [Sulfurisphaera javensis]|uniref:Winged helix-turn-helix transcriptional regulator n=2 Tax=Sulfurisphaera javensis TaxID=2049879 RepID=A0AAT9GQ58_9CREN
MLTLTVHSSVFTTVYYNGTITIHVINQTSLYLPLQNISKIYSTTPFKLFNNTIFLSSSNATLIYSSDIKNEIKINEPYNIAINIIITSTSQITYLSTSPDFVNFQNNLLNLTFYTSNLTLIYTNYSQSSNSFSPNSNIFILLLISFSLSLLSTGVLTYLLLKNIRKGKIEEPILISGLDERDRLVLDAISKGADSIAKISRMTGLSRATVYRRVKKLVSLGYVKKIREGNKIRYEENKKE